MIYRNFVSAHLMLPEREEHTGYALSKQFLRTVDFLRFSEDDIEIHYDELDCRLR